jgi:hypothetical protein
VAHGEANKTKNKVARAFERVDRADCVLQRQVDKLLQKVDTVEAETISTLAEVEKCSASTTSDLNTTKNMATAATDEAGMAREATLTLTTQIKALQQKVDTVEAATISTMAKVDKCLGSTSDDLNKTKNMVTEATGEAGMASEATLALARRRMYPGDHLLNTWLQHEKWLGEVAYVKHAGLETAGAVILYTCKRRRERGEPDTIVVPLPEHGWKGVFHQEQFQRFGAAWETRTCLGCGGGVLPYDLGDETCLLQGFRMTNDSVTVNLRWDPWIRGACTFTPPDFHFEPDKFPPRSPDPNEREWEGEDKAASDYYGKHWWSQELQQRRIQKGRVVS